MQTIPLFVLPQIHRELGGGNALNVIEIGGITGAQDPGGSLDITLATISLLGIGSMPPPSYAIAISGTSGVKFASLDGMGLGGVRRGRGMIAYGIKRRT